MNIYVGNLPFSAQEEELRGLFAEFGEVKSVRIVTNQMDGRSKGFGFVEMGSEEVGRAAIEALDQSEWKGRMLRVNPANPRPEQGAGGGERRYNDRPRTGGHRGGPGGGGGQRRRDDW